MFYVHPSAETIVYLMTDSEVSQITSLHNTLLAPSIIVLLLYHVLSGVGKSYQISGIYWAGPAVSLPTLQDPSFLFFNFIWNRSNLNLIILCIIL